MVGLYHRRLRILRKENWLYQRGFSEETIRTYQLGHTGSAYSIPIWDTGSIQTLRFRRDEETPGNRPKYWGLPGANSQMLFAPRGIGAILIWCEGEYDALLAVQTGYTAVSLTNGIHADPLKYISRLTVCQEIRIAVDADTRSFARSLWLLQIFRERLPATKVNRIRLPAKDITEVYQLYGEAKLNEVLGAK